MKRYVVILLCQPCVKALRSVNDDRSRIQLSTGGPMGGVLDEHEMECGFCNRPSPVLFPHLVPAGNIE